jgi:DNA polymerase III epsilon subunit-like protein
MFLRSNLEVPKWLLSNSLKPNWLDPYVWAQTFEPYAKGQGRYKQAAVAERLGIFPEKSHRALDDARICAKIINEFSRKEGLLPEKWDDLIAIQRMNSAKQEYEILKFLNSKKE